MRSHDDEQGDDARMFRHFLDGDDAAFMTLFRKYNQRLFVYCLKILGNQHHAEDAAQGMWERVINLRRTPPTETVRNPGGLFLRVARNLCIDHLRAQRPFVSLEESEEVTEMLVAQREPSELEDLALAMLDRLSFEYREVLILNLYCGYRFDEIAVMLGRTPDAIWARASRARTQLRRMVAAAIGPGAQANPTTTTQHTPRTENRT